MTKYPIINLYDTGQKIKRIMKERGVTVRDVQNYLGLATPQGIYHWFNGRNMPSIDNLYALSELLCIPIDDMLAGNRNSRKNYENANAFERFQFYFNWCVNYS